MISHEVLFRAVLLKVLGIFGELIQCHVTTRHMVMHIIFNGYQDIYIDMVMCLAQKNVGLFDRNENHQVTEG